VEADRPILEEKIHTLMVDTGIVPKQTSRDVALDAFDAHVRHSFPRALRSSLGPMTVSYRHIACAGLASLTQAIDVLAAGNLERVHLVYFAHRCLIMFGLVPLFSALSVLATRRCLNVYGWRENLFLFVLTLGILGFIYGLNLFSEAMVARARHSVSASALTVLGQVCSIAFVVSLYVRPACADERLRLSVRSQFRRDTNEVFSSQRDTASGICSPPVNAILPVSSHAEATVCIIQI